MEEYIQVCTTSDDRETLEKIAKTLVEKRLAACAQIMGPIDSTYWWNGKIETSREWLCVVKSVKRLYREIENTVKDLHNYEVPELIAIPIIGGSDDYLNWLASEIKG